MVKRYLLPLLFWSIVLTDLTLACMGAWALTDGWRPPCLVECGQPENLDP